MAEPFLGEVRLMSFVYAPKNWALCNGQLLPINQNQALFSLLGTSYGGDGRTTFALPNLQGRVPVHIGNSFTTQGQTGGEHAHTLSQSELPPHTHAVAASTSTTGAVKSPSNAFPGVAGNVYHAPQAPVALRPDSVTNAGGSQPHVNAQPFLTLSFCIALIGIFPSRT